MGGQIGGLLQAADIYRSNDASEIEAKFQEWVKQGYFVLNEYQRDAFSSGRYVLIAFVVSQRKNIFEIY